MLGTISMKLTGEVVPSQGQAPVTFINIRPSVQVAQPGVFAIHTRARANNPGRAT